MRRQRLWRPTTRPRDVGASPTRPPDLPPSPLPNRAWRLGGTQHETGIAAAEPEAVGNGDAHRMRFGLVRDMAQTAFRVGLVQVNGWRNGAAVERDDAGSC